MRPQGTLFEVSLASLAAGSGGLLGVPSGAWLLAGVSLVLPLLVVLLSVLRAPSRAARPDGEP